MFVAIERQEQSVCAKFNVLAHECRVHADEFDGQCGRDKFFFNVDCVFDDLCNAFGFEFVLQLCVEFARKVTVHAFVSGYEFIGRAQPGQQSSFFQPEDCAKGSGEEYALNRCERDDAFCEVGFIGVTPLQCPLGFFFDARHGFDGPECVLFLGGIFDVGVDEQSIGFGVYVFDCDLPSVEASYCGVCDLCREVHAQILVYDGIGCGEEREHVRQEVLFVFTQLFPMRDIVIEVKFFRGPKTRLRLLVALPCPLFVLLDGEEREPLIVAAQEWFHREQM